MTVSADLVEKVGPSRRDQLAEAFARHRNPWMVGAANPVVYPAEYDACYALADIALSALAGRLLPEPSEVREDIEVWTAGVRYPCFDMGRAWRKFGELKAEGRPDVKIVKRTVVTGPWREVGDE